GAQRRLRLRGRHHRSSAIRLRSNRCFAAGGRHAERDQTPLAYHLQALERFRLGRSVRLQADHVSPAADLLLVAALGWTVSTARQAIDRPDAEAAGVFAVDWRLSQAAARADRATRPAQRSG